MVLLQIFLAAAAARLERGMEVEVVLPQIDDAARDVGAVVRDALQIRQDIRQDEARLNAAIAVFQAHDMVRAHPLLELVDDLREWHFGSLEGTSNREMPPQPWGDYPVAFGGESESELRTRMVAVLSRIMARPQHDCVLAVSHGSACQEFLEYVTGGGELPDNGAVLHFGYCDGAFSLLGW